MTAANQPPSPAIVSQEAARRAPRAVLLALCLAYVLAGFVGRGPWKGADVASLGYMLALLEGDWPQWLAPHMLGQGADALLPHWLGALSIRALAPLGVPAALAARLPFALMLVGTLAATWGAVRHLALEPGAQPVAFAFGGEAAPGDYAHALADGALLALIATLGLAEGAHEAAPAAAQLCFAALAFYALAVQPRHDARALVLLALALAALALSGAPRLALGYAALALLGVPRQWSRRRRRRTLTALLTLAAALALLVWRLHVLRAAALAEPQWRTGAEGWLSLLRLLLWFTWPAWPLALWTLWRWRRQFFSAHRHLRLPLALAAVPLLAAVFTTAGARTLLLALPALAALAALALPTFSRAAAAFIDWFTVLFFTGWGIVIWVVWVAMMTGIPAKPAANVARLAPHYTPLFQWPAFAAAVVGTGAWLALARWRTGRHRAALWKSLALPAGGAALCWLLLMTLWLNALDYGRCYEGQMRAVQQAMVEAGASQPACVQVWGLGEVQLAAARVHGHWRLRAATDEAAHCPWLLIDARVRGALPQALAGQWEEWSSVPRPADKDESLLLLRRAAPVLAAPVEEKGRTDR